MLLDLVDWIIEMAAHQTCDEKEEIDNSSPIIVLTKWLRPDTRGDPIEADRYHRRERPLHLRAL